MENLPIFLAILTISLSSSVICKNPDNSFNNRLKTAPTVTSTNGNNLELQFDLRSSNASINIDNSRSDVTLNKNNRQILLNEAKNPWNIILYHRNVSLQQLLNYNATAIEETNDTKVIEKFWPLYTYNRSIAVVINDVNQSQVDVETACDELSYIRRSFDAENQKIDSPVDLATKLASSKNQFDRFLIIMGHRGSGKTVTLVKMLHILRQIAKESWTLAVDLSNITSLISNSSVIEIFRQNLDENSHKLFRQVMENNPSKVNILFDNYDRIADKKLRNKIFEYCVENNEKGVGIVLTTSHLLDQDFLQSNSPKIVQIPEITKNQMEFYLTKNWQSLLGARHHYQQISIYAKAVADILNHIQIIPLTFSTIKHLSQLLYFGDENIFDSNSFVSVQNYIKETTPSNPPKLMKMLLNMRLNKMALADQLMGMSNGSLAEAINITGELALKNILTDELTQLKDNNYPSMDSEYLHYPKPQFIDVEISRYLASKLFFNSNITNKIRSELSFLLTNKKYGNVVEYINGNLKNNNNTLKLIIDVANKYIAKNGYQKLIDILIENRFDDILSNILKHRNKQQMVNYFLQNGTFNVQSRSEYKFGLLIMDKNSRMSLRCPRLEMVLRKKMEQTQLDIFRMIDEVRPNALSKSDLRGYLQHIVLNDSKPSFMIYKTILDRLSPQKPGFLNRLMLMTFRKAGRDSKLIVSDLIHRGADVRATDNNGKNLIHLAVQQSDPELLEFLVDKQKFLISDVLPESVLIEALDANPFNWFSRPQFWQMMQYLLSNQNFTVPKQHHSHTVYPNVYKLRANEISKMFYELLKETNPNTTDQLISDLIFVDLSQALQSSDLSSVRRRFVLQDAYNNLEILKTDFITLTELLLAYRGLDSLDPMEEQNFFATLTIAISRDSKLRLTATQQRRISDKLCKTIGTESDMQNLLDWIQHRNLTDVTEQKFIGDLVDNLLVCLTESVSIPPSLLGIEKNVLLTRSEIFSRSISHRDPYHHILLLQLQSLSVKNPYYGSECIDQKAEDNPEDCHISKDDLDKYIETETKNGVTKNVINTDVFNDLIDESNNNDEDNLRIDQLIGATAMLAFEKGYELIGNQQSSTLSILEAGSTEISSSSGLHRFRSPISDNIYGYTDFFSTNPSNNQDPYVPFNPKRPDFGGMPWVIPRPINPNDISQDYSTTPSPYGNVRPFYGLAFLPHNEDNAHPFPPDHEFFSPPKVPEVTNLDILPLKILPDLVPERPLPFRPLAAGRNG